MKEQLHQDRLFEKIINPNQTITGREFEDCVFKNCDFSNGDFSQNRFTDCQFVGCNLAMLRLSGATLNDVVFKECKLTGIDFSACEEFLFTVRFENCLLDYASFLKRKMPKTHFIDSSLKNAVFEQANLTKAKFDNTDLAGAVFERTNLNEANLVTAFNYTIDPELNNIKKSKFSQSGLIGLLARYDIRVE
ncbi:pentapeptide repeat-containing protein [Pontibacter sp. JH31]|uniref:Pentapeptide repeat-containing protein n=1 Tax=Pontibacter aquaedesilientis TaxID=2766980 RepID=A0ABR7XHX9_9BACT|nr:pentapeptide repeat-containing protein [Pontibacter aquaedesilientis]MBD1397887.1 pentapeptide repeat-containing protein [Pontibacter aquaedesilientis]